MGGGGSSGNDETDSRGVPSSSGAIGSFSIASNSRLFSGQGPFSTPPDPNNPAGILPLFGGRFSPFQSHPSGFQSSVLFPSDIQHPLSQAVGGSTGVHNHTPVLTSGDRQSESPSTAVTPSEDDLPNSPPIDMRQFDYDSLDAYNHQ